MNRHSSDFKMLQGLCFRLLPIQVLLAVVGSVNGIISSLFASNFVGTDAMSAIGLYSPVNSFFLALNTMMMGGSQIICGKYMGRHQVSGMQNVFSVNMLMSVLHLRCCFLGRAFVILPAWSVPTLQSGRISISISSEWQWVLCRRSSDSSFQASCRWKMKPD